MSNVLTKVSQKLSSELSDEEILEKITLNVNRLKKVYSYLIYAKYQKNKLIGWSIEYSLSQIDKYNTLCSETIAKEIADIIRDNRESSKSVIAYKQPSIELMLDLYKPLIHKLAREQSDRWTELEYEDAVSMCQLTMINLYRKGYYVHRYLLQKSFNNYVLMELRRSRNKPEVHSFEKVIHKDGENGAILLADIIPDKEAELEAEAKEEAEVFNVIFEEVKSIIIELIGERQFEQLLRDYGNKHTTPWSRKKMQQIKRNFDKLGITWKYFER